MCNKKKPKNQGPRRELGGLSYAFASEIMAHRADMLDPADKSALANAIRRAFPETDPTQQHLIQRRYLEVYMVPPAEAVVAVDAGFSSPIHAMRSGIIKRRKRVGFVGERES